MTAEQLTIRGRLAPCGDPLLYAADNMSLYHAHEKPKEGQEHSHDEIQIALPLGGSFHAAWQTAGGHGRQQQVPPGSLSLSSSRQPHTIRVQQETELAVIWLPAPLIARTAHELTPHGSAEIADSNALQDHLLRHLCLSLLTEVRQSHPPARLYVDAVANLLAAHLVRHHSVGGAVVHETGGLSPRALRRVTDYIREHLDQDISLADLASIAHLSESRFGFLFRQSTGLSAYQYLLTRRIERAKDLLCVGRLSVGEIALQVGFCDQSQFTRQFRKRVGVTPKAYAVYVQR